MNNKNYDKCMQAITTANELCPHPIGYYVLAKLHIQSERLEMANSCIQQALLMKNNVEL